MIGLLSKLFATRAPAHDEALVLSEEVSERDGARAPSYKDTTIRTPGGQKLRAITVDVDEKGARVRFVGQQSLSGLVDVSINGVCRQRPAKVVWTDGHDIGLQFMPQETAATSAI
ncbi:MAG: PilZ domain-containing protein [Pseudomonadota bacterium]